jgi:hypothetical protein
MDVVKETKTALDRGVLALGTSGQWEIEIDETTSGKDRWFVQLEGPSIYFYFEIPSLRILDDVIAYLGNKTARDKSKLDKNGRLLIGGDKRTPVFLARDDEYADRVFLVVGSNPNHMLHYTISGTDIEEIAAAFRQAKEDIDS